MARYFYMRVSTADQNLSRQEDAARKEGIPEENWFADKMTGVARHRPELDRLLATLQPGDQLVVSSFDRLARSTKQLLDLSEHFKENGIQLHSLKENIDTSTPMGNFFFIVIGAISELERELLKERQMDGIRAKIAREGKCGGRKPLPKEKLDLAIEQYMKAEKPATEICKAIGISRASLYKELASRGIRRD